MTFLTLTCLSVSFAPGPLSPRQLLLSGAVVVWALRLGIFLTARIHTGPMKDSRFDKIKLSVPRFCIAWTLQGLWCFMTAFPVYLINVSGSQQPLGTRDVVGVALFAIGLSVEVIADEQKKNWRELSTQQKKHPFIDSGLWCLSRHPNYLGEIILWWGVLLSASSEFNAPLMWISILSPLLVSFLLIFVSGIPQLEHSGKARWGETSAYIAYIHSTPVLIPFVGRAGHAAF